jgi:hypothetical protein
LEAAGVVTAAGVPPADDTFEMPVPLSKKMLPSSAQLAPEPGRAGTPAIAAGGPPAAGTFLI